MKYFPVIAILALLLPSFAFACGVAFDSQGNSNGGTGGVTSINYTDTIISTTNTVLYVGVLGNTLAAGSQCCASVTAKKGGVTTNLTQETAISPDSPTSGTRFAYSYCMLNPDSGANTITVNANSSSFLGSDSVVYSGADQSHSCPPNDMATSSATNVTTFSQTVTPTTASSWVASWVNEAGGNSLIAGANTTIRNTDAGLSTSFYDNNAAVSGATTLNYAQSGTPPNANWTGARFTIPPASCATNLPWDWLSPFP